MGKTFYIKNYCHIKNGSISCNGGTLLEKHFAGPASFLNGDGSGDHTTSYRIKSPDLTSFLKMAYRHFELDYPKYFKMDRLSKLAFMAAEVLFTAPAAFLENQSFEKVSRENRFPEKLSEENKILEKPSQEKTSPKNLNTAIVLSNRASSLDTDRKYQKSISDPYNFYPSPAVFVYTLPNICIGEISIRHRLRSENSFFIFDAFNAGFLADYAESLLGSGKAGEVLCGWVDVDKNEYEAFMYIVSPTGNILHSEEQLTKLYRTP